ncbi:hypothetical protein [Listeria booriae]|uniref:Uncharacterized protein n=1 Tax=Listeria booriae TaxID=1552123 RepID=A0A7X1CUJ3_9LIST|nr:hypothetical protein [Listeria booriae]MBC1777405.1 hypothetical protein [Listeria booriae]MBC1913044.1 hypothetical protein [Listeria booriae]MBC2023520.1 hypothetical protein [Listeria booriae]MBC2055181.1 hypothetical protein [Listeria booriae]MBC2315895.1 hypothetical protein [Listeria booriae]
MSFRKKVLPYLLTAVLVMVGVFSISSTEAFAMNSKGSSQIAFHTDANTYSKNATTIDVYGLCNSDGVSVELYRKGNNKAVKINDVYKGFTYNSKLRTYQYKTSFALKGLPAGQYDVCVYGSWGSNWYRAELQHYLTVQR